MMLFIFGCRALCGLLAVLLLARAWNQRRCSGDEAVVNCSLATALIGLAVLA